MSLLLCEQKALVNKDKSFDSFRMQAEDFLCKILPNSPSSTTQYTPGNEKIMSRILYLMDITIISDSKIVTQFNTGGLMFKMSSVNLQYVTSITFLLSTYGKYMMSTGNTFKCGNLLVTPNSLRALAKRQVKFC